MKQEGEKGGRKTAKEILNSHTGVTGIPNAHQTLIAMDEYASSLLSEKDKEIEQMQNVIDNLSIEVEGLKKLQSIKSQLSPSEGDGVSIANLDTEFFEKFCKKNPHRRYIEEYYSFNPELIIEWFKSKLSPAPSTKRKWKNRFKHQADEKTIFKADGSITGKWFYAYMDSEGRNQHSELLDSRELAEKEYDSLPNVHTERKEAVECDTHITEVGKYYIECPVCGKMGIEVEKQ